MTDRPVRIACFGDSLTEGYGLAHDEALPVVLERRLRDEGIRTTCLNFGISGETATDGLERLERVIASEPDIAVVEFGANDCFVGDPVDLVKASLSTIIEALQSKGIPVLLVGITAFTNMDDKYKMVFDPIFGELADKYDLPLYPDILSSYFGNSMLTLMDGMHPNAQGVEAISRGIYPLLKEMVDALD